MFTSSEGSGDLHICLGSPEPLLLDNLISCDGSFKLDLVFLQTSHSLKRENIIYIT